MSKHLTDKDIGKIVDILDDWMPEIKLTWDRFVQRIDDELGIITTRQTIQKYARIKSAYLEVKAIYSGKNSGSDQKVKLPASLKIAANRIEILENKISRLEKENDQLLEQFQTWAYNAYIHGLTEQKLSAPLPPRRHN